MNATKTSHAGRLTMTTEAAAEMIESLRDTRDRLANDLATMPSSKWFTRYHTDRRNALAGVTTQIREINERMGW